MASLYQRRSEALIHQQVDQGPVRASQADQPEIRRRQKSRQDREHHQPKNLPADNVERLPLQSVRRLMAKAHGADWPDGNTLPTDFSPVRNSLGARRRAKARNRGGAV